MADDYGNADDLIVQQKAMFRLAANRGFTQELIHQDTQIAATSLSDYATGKTKLSLVALRRIARIPEFPAELLSLVLGGTGRCIVNEAKEGDHDTFAGGCIDFASEHAKARHPNSPGGVDIVDCEDKALNDKRQQLRSVGQ